MAEASPWVHQAWVQGPGFALIIIRKPVTAVTLRSGGGFNIPKFQEEILPGAGGVG